MIDTIGTIKETIEKSVELHKSIADDINNQNNIAQVAEIIAIAIKKGNKLLVCGNGGSAADAQHIAGEFVNRFYYDRPPMACIALTTDTSVITAVGNDYDFSRIFAKQTEANGTTGDVLLGISTSGKSKDVLEAFKVARRKGIATVALIGGNLSSDMAKSADYVLSVDSSETPRIQEGHMLIYHVICQLVEQLVYPR